jgi:hypothetical protein
MRAHTWRCVQAWVDGWEGVAQEVAVIGSLVDAADGGGLQAE